jgi:hypothetical protein
MAETGRCKDEPEIWSGKEERRGEASERSGLGLKVSSLLVRKHRPCGMDGRENGDTYLRTRGTREDAGRR